VRLLAICSLVAVAMAAAPACARGPTSAPSSDGGDRASAAPIDAGTGCHGNDAECGPDQYCVFQPGLCGKGQKPGVCRAKPGACPAEVFAPVCGCDAKIYDSECAARSAGIDLAVMGRCGGRMPDWIPCGKQFCNVRRDYCAIYLSDVFDLPTDYFCRPLPAACLPADGSAHPTCDCFPGDTPCRSFCGPMVTEGLPGFHLTCQGVSPPASSAH
jgi:hypothetical protein